MPNTCTAVTLKFHTIEALDNLKQALLDLVYGEPGSQLLLRQVITGFPEFLTVVGNIPGLQLGQPKVLLCERGQFCELPLRRRPAVTGQVFQELVYLL